jgi:sugar lactone lactonase YvrE
MSKKIVLRFWKTFVLLCLLPGAAHAGRFALVADGGNKRVAEFYVSGTTWTYVADFVNPGTPLGDLAPLNAPNCVAQDQQGRIYVSDQGAAGANRILRFDTNGVFMDLVGTNGLNGFYAPGNGIDDMVCGPDGNIYGTLAFGAGNNQILKFNVATTNWSVLYSNSATLNTPRGLDFAPDGNLYVNSRGTARMLVISTNGALLRTNATFSGTFSTTPMGNRWDAAGNRFICTAGNGNSVICACTTNGALTLLTGTNPSGGQGANKSILGALADGTNVFYAAYMNPGHVYLCNNASTTSATLADVNTSPALNNATFMNFATGFGIGALQDVRLNLTRTRLLAGTVRQAQLLGDYMAQYGVDITADAGTTWSSSDPGVFTVSAGGAITAVAPGTATLSATNSGLSARIDLTVVPFTTTLIHRFGFTNDASDSVGTAYGSVYGSDYAFTDGQLAFMPVGQYDYSYVDFGPYTINDTDGFTFDALTFEAWASFGTNYNWARLFDFGNNDGVNGTGYIYLSPHSSAGTTRVAMKTPTGGETDVDVPGTLDNQTNVHVVVVFHPLAGYIKVYLNGILAAQKTDVSGQDLANVLDYYSYLGKSQFFADPAANLSVDEFRIYSGVLDATNVAFDYAAGPNNLVAAPGAVQSLSLVVNTNMSQQDGQAVVAYANFANVTGVPVNNFPGISFTSDNTNVLTISASGAVKAVGFGAATITVSYGGQTLSYTVNVAPLPQVRFLVADGGNNRVLLCDATGTNWNIAAVFASGVYDGLPLSEPTGLAQDAAGNVFVSEGVAGGRVLKFNSNGAYLGTIGADGVDFTGTPGYLALDTNGNVYMSTPFSAHTIVKYDATGHAWSVFVPTTDGATYTLNNPVGIAFDANGNLYVCNRGSFNAANRSIVEFDANGVYVPNPNTGLDFATGLTGPQGLTWDAANNRFLVTVAATQISAVDTNGVVTPLSGAVGADILSAASIGANVFFSDYSGAGVYALTGFGSAALVAGGIVHAHQLIPSSLPPDLRISLNGTNALIAWPYSVAAFHLKSSASLNPADWQDVAAPAAQNGNVMQTTLPLSGDAKFFRLSH